MTESESVALPLGDAPLTNAIITDLGFLVKTFLEISFTIFMKNLRIRLILRIFGETYAVILKKPKVFLKIRLKFHPLCDIIGKSSDGSTGSISARGTAG